MTAYTLRISIDCPHCRGGVPVNAITEEVLCQNCLNSIPLAQTWWETILDTETLDEALDCEPGHGKSVQHLGGMSEKIEAGNRAPRCQKCKTDFPALLLQEAAAKGGFACGGCNQRIRVRTATPLALHLISNADLLVHEDESGTGLDKDNIATEPVLFSCMACSAALKVDGSSRTPKCEHCGSANYLPDALWLRLHPAAVSHAFFVTIKQKPGHERMQEEDIKADMDTDRLVKRLRNEGVEAKVLVKAFEMYEDEDDVLEVIAAHPNCPHDLLLQLVDTDRYYGIRVAAAKRRHVPVNVMAVLANDTDSDVKKALIRRQDLFQQAQSAIENILHDMDLDELNSIIERREFPESKLYELCDYCDTNAAKKLLRAPNISLRCLQRIGSNPDNRPMVKEHSLYQGLSWWRKWMFFA